MNEREREAALSRANQRLKLEAAAWFLAMVALYITVGVIADWGWMITGILCVLAVPLTIQFWNIRRKMVADRHANATTADRTLD